MKIVSLWPPILAKNTGFYLGLINAIIFSCARDRHGIPIGNFLFITGILLPIFLGLCLVVDTLFFMFMMLGKRYLVTPWFLIGMGGIGLFFATQACFTIAIVREFNLLNGVWNILNLVFVYLAFLMGDVAVYLLIRKHEISNESTNLKPKQRFADHGSPLTDEDFRRIEWQTVK